MTNFHLTISEKNKSLTTNLMKDERKDEGIWNVDSWIFISNLVLL